MPEPNERVQKVLKDFEAMQFFGKSERFPNSFYRLNEEEQAQAVRIHKKRITAKRKPPYNETK